MPRQRPEKCTSDTVLQQRVAAVKGVGSRLARRLEDRGLRTVEDLLFNLPLGYLDQRGGDQIGRRRPGDYASFVATVLSAREVHYRRRKIFEVILSDGSGVVIAKWFHYGRWLPRRFQRFTGDIRVSGTVRIFGGKLEIHHPEVEELDGGAEEEGGIVPRYGAIPGVAPRAYRRIMNEVVNNIAPRVPETLPEAVRRYFNLPDLHSALRQVHFPSELPPNDRLSPGLRRLIFEELFFLELLVVRSREELRRQATRALVLERDFLSRAGRLLPFRLTGAQKRVMREITGDLTTTRPMNRLVQGDVGCGKTVVALLAALIAVSNGLQAAVLTPTEILAHQHFVNMEPYARSLGIPLVLLTSKLKAGQKRNRTEAVASGEARLIIGTHALIQRHVNFRRLGLVIVDEQQRFGVWQRLALRQKGESPHVLVMTATPIPRTLAMTVCGDLDVSVIDEVPPGRTPVQTRVIDAGDRSQAYERLQHELGKGRQGYIIYPLVEETEKSDLRDVTTMTAHLKNVFPGYGLAMLHGRMPPEEKQAIMSAFARKEIRLLVATTVVEVGIDVAEATVMIIEHPERFGLSQLHQLRGRVGRGGERSYCFLVSEGGGRHTRQRLAVMEQTTDGFRIAEEDLRLRGPGDIIGVRQAGLTDLRLADLVRDQSVLAAARRAAQALLRKDPDLSKPAHAAIRARLHRQASQAAELLGTS